MTPYGVMLHECEFVAENIHRKLTEYHKMNVSPLHGILSSVFVLVWGAQVRICCCCCGGAAAAADGRDGREFVVASLHVVGWAGWTGGGASWGRLGPSWGVLWASWRRIRVLLGVLGASWGSTGVKWCLRAYWGRLGCLGASWGCIGGVFGHLGASGGVFGASWGVLGRLGRCIGTLLGR
jgi:hypothetical protein